MSTLNVKSIVVVLATMCSIALAGCSPQGDPVESSSGSSAPVPLRVASLKGPTTMGLVSLMSQPNPLGDQVVSFTMETNPDTIASQLIKSEVDIALIPTTYASILYSNTRDIQIISINTDNVLHLVTKGTQVTSIEDLAGKTIYTTGQGATPHAVLLLLLTNKGLADTVNVEFLSEPMEVIAHMAASDSGIAVLPEPFVSIATSQDPNLTVSLDLGTEFEKTTGVSVVTGVTVVRRDFADTHPDIVETYLQAAAESTAFTKNHRDEAAKLITAQGITPTNEIAQAAIPRSGITAITGVEARTLIMKYLSALYMVDVEMVGGTPPEDTLIR